MRRGAVAAAGAAVLLVAGCSAKDAAPTKVVTVTVPTAPPAAAAAVLGPTGPGTAKPCSGTAIPVGTDPQPV
ncbi:MAG TPA: right-handed parallel beta-helix repeat-containing protein, partial [Kribbella sp.]|nr:right-handed parallel beta-helix repeat-containing protein [Kribbella sp.]